MKTPGRICAEINKEEGVSEEEVLVHLIALGWNQRYEGSMQSVDLLYLDPETSWPFIRTKSDISETP